MRINNPKSIVGFQRTTNADELAYNLATVGQVKKAIYDLEQEFITLLHGAENYGTAQGHGYAWLNSEGKVHTDLLPALAITDTHVVPQAELKTANNLPTASFPEGEFTPQFENLMDWWLKDQVQNQGKTFQKGDIVIVTVPTGETPDPVFAGSYIITEVPEYNTSGNFLFSKLAYTDGNIVKINGVAPKNSAGDLRLYLSDILQERYIDKFVTATSGAAEAASATKALEDSVYRLVTLDEGNDGYRFAFIDDSNVGQGAVIPYTKLREFTDEKESTADRFTAVNDAIAELTAKHDRELAALEEKHDTELAALEEKHDTEHLALSGEFTEKTRYISGTIGIRTDTPDRELSATIFAQTKKLRQDVDDNYGYYNNTVDLTNQMLSLIHNNVKNLHYGLEKRAVRLYMQEFRWEASEAVSSSFDTTLPQYKYQVSSPDVSGVIVWTHTHSPLGTGENSVGDVSTNNGQGISNIQSEERVLAVYDEDGNLINVDMKIKGNSTTGLKDTDIIVETEFIGTDGTGKYINTLEGKVWTILLAKTISGIDINTALDSVDGRLV